VGHTIFGKKLATVAVGSALALAQLAGAPQASRAAELAQPSTAPSGLATIQGQPARPTPHAKTQQEYEDYNAAYGTNGGQAAEKAASDFDAKYPDSELRGYLYSKAMHEYQMENNSGKMLAMSTKVLALDPDNSVALVLTATILADSLRDDDIDRQEKISQIRKFGHHALETVDASFVPPAGASPQQIGAYKNTVRSMAFAAIGMMELKNKDDAGAEKDLKSAADLNSIQPDPLVWYHLALAQHGQKKYSEALASIDRALQNTGSNPDLAALARDEKELLLKATKPSPASMEPPPPGKTPE